MKPVATERSDKALTVEFAAAAQALAEAQVVGRSRHQPAAAGGHRRRLAERGELRRRQLAFGRAHVALGEAWGLGFVDEERGIVRRIPAPSDAFGIHDDKTELVGEPSEPGEELGTENPDAEFVWVLDPVDGTREQWASVTADRVVTLKRGTGKKM